MPSKKMCAHIKEVLARFYEGRSTVSNLVQFNYSTIIYIKHAMESMHQVDVLRHLIVHHILCCHQLGIN